MGIFDSAKEHVSDENIEAAGDKFDQHTDGKYDEQTDKAQDAVRDHLDGEDSDAH